MCRNMFLCVNFRKFANLIFNTTHFTCRCMPSLPWKLKAMGFSSYFIAVYIKVKRKIVKLRQLRYWNRGCQKSYRILYLDLIQLAQMSDHWKAVVNMTTNIWLILECEDFLTWWESINWMQ